MNLTSRLIVVLGIAFLSCGVASAQCTGTPDIVPCTFQGLNNTPTNAFLFLDEQLHLVVCAIGTCSVSGTQCYSAIQCPVGQTCDASTTPFGVEWQLPTPLRTGHSDWVDFGYEAFEDFESPDDLMDDDAELQIDSKATYEGQSSEITIPTLLKDAGSTLNLWVDYTNINATDVRYEVFASREAEREGTVEGAATILVADFQTNPVNVTDWPAKTWISRWEWDAPVDFVLPGSVVATGRILAAIPVGGSTYSRTSEDPKVNNTARGEIRQVTTEEAIDICTTGRQFTITEEAVNNNPFVGIRMPAVSPRGFIASSLILAVWVTWFLWRRNRTAA